MQYQTVLEVYKKISQRLENLETRGASDGDMSCKDALDNTINELNWVRAELEMTREVNPEK